jgi:hypothetical protein
VRGKPTIGLTRLICPEARCGFVHLALALMHNITSSHFACHVQLQLLQALVSAYPSTPLIAVLFNGGPVSSPWLYTHATAVLEAWYPGYEAGNAIFDVLSGVYSPAGRLPVTIVSGMSELPLYTGVTCLPLQLTLSVVQTVVCWLSP